MSLTKFFGTKIYELEQKPFEHGNTNYSKHGENMSIFDFKTSIGANLINFVDSNYHTTIFHSTQIVSESIKYSKNKNKNKDYKNGKYVLLKGIDYDYNNDKIKQFKSFGEIVQGSRDRNTGDFYKIMNSVLSAVVELEDKMLAEVRADENK